MDDVDQPKKTRHGCLTAYLIFMIVVLVPSVALYLFFPAAVQRTNPEIPPGGRFIFALVGAVQIFCMVAIWRWKKWGFYVFMTFGLLFGAFNAILTGSVLTFLTAPISILLLYGILQIGGPERKAWSQLE
jgi:hypothetical protein